LLTVLSKIKYVSFPPEPNGLHIGHAKSICLQFGLGLKYNAPVNLRLMMIQPAKEEQEYVDAIKRFNGYQWAESVTLQTISTVV
jgi:glutaminyl-tRNA synthetase